MPISSRRRGDCSHGARDLFLTIPVVHRRDIVCRLESSETDTPCPVPTISSAAATDRHCDSSPTPDATLRPPFL